MTETATLAGGCFWCLEAVFQNVRGVKSTLPGYSGGHDANPVYETVSQGITGHAEAVSITFSPDTISYREILRIFFTIHDPTTLNRQGNDIGTQYRSAIFYHTPQQKSEAEAAISETAEKTAPAPCVTQLTPFTRFYPAEEEHRNFYRDNPQTRYCQLVIAPKMSQFSHCFPQYENETSVTA